MPKKKKTVPYHPDIWPTSQGTVFGRKPLISPAGRLIFSNLREPRKGYKTEDMFFNAELEWQNKDEIIAQAAYKPFMKGLKDFIDLACPDVDRDILELPIKEKLLNEDDPESPTIWRLKAKAKEEDPPELYDFRTKELIEKGADMLYNGCIAAVLGAPYYAPVVIEGQLRHLVLMRPWSVWHVEDGQKTERDASIPADTPPNYFNPDADPTPAKPAKPAKAVKEDKNDAGDLEI